jgi:hypothetical protein
VSFSLSQAARVELRILRRGGKATVKRFSVSGHAGQNSVAFSGAGLSAGSYTLRAVASDSAGRKAGSFRVDFKVLAS